MIIFFYSNTQSIWYIFQIVIFYKFLKFSNFINKY